MIRNILYQQNEERNNLLMITWDKEGVIDNGKSNIRLVKAWKWLCGIESVT